MTEARLTLKIRKALEKEGAYAAKIHGNTFSVGIPDLLVCYRGWFIGMEVKLPGKERRVTELQSKNLADIKEAGGFSAVITSVDGALAVLREIDALEEAA